MIRPVKTWILFAVTLAVTVQTTFAGGRSGGSRSFGGNVSRPAFRAPVAAPRVNSGSNMSQFQQPKTRTPVVGNGVQGGTLRSTVPVTAPQTGVQSGIVGGGKGGQGAATRNLIGITNPQLSAPVTTGRPPIAAGGNLTTNPGGTLPSQYSNIRRQIGGGNLGGITDGTVLSQGGLTGVPAHGRHECAPPRLVRPETPETGGPSDPPQRVRRETPATGGPSDPPRLVRPETPETGGPSETRLGAEPVDGVGTAVQDLEPIRDGVGTGVADLEPIDRGTNPGQATPPVPTPDDHRLIRPLPGEMPGNRLPIRPADGQPGTDLSSIIDAVSGLVGAIGSVSGSSGSGGADAGYAAPSDGGFSGSPAVESQPVAVPEPAAKMTTEPVADSKELDIELTDVRLVDAGSLELKTGPRFRLTYRNKGAVDVPKFHVTVAVDAGRTLTETAEIVTVEAVGLKPGKSLMVDVRLPVEALKMATDKSGKAAPYSLLAAILDSDESLAESNKENNVMVLAREAIKPIEKTGLVAK